MKATELRIGNLVYDGGSITQLSLADFYNMYLDDKCEFKPITLTEEWLVKFGFIEHEVVKCLYNKKHNGFEIDITIEGDNVLDIQLSSTNISGAYPNKELFKYVHQLQNIYFALTGEELTIK